MLSFPNRLSFKGIWSSDMKMGARGIHLERTRPVENTDSATTRDSAGPGTEAPTITPSRGSINPPSS